MPPVEDVTIREHAHIDIERNSKDSPSVMVKVLAASGIFKNGVLYQAGTELAMNKATADDFARIGEVEILEGYSKETN